MAAPGMDSRAEVGKTKISGMEETSRDRFFQRLRRLDLLILNCIRWPTFSAPPQEKRGIDLRGIGSIEGTHEEEREQMIAY